MVWPAVIGALGTIGGALLSRRSSKDAQDQNVAYQREFAQHGIQWKVEDAQRAGIHPLYALGAQTHSFSPIQVNDPGQYVAQMGQDISRAMSASADARDRKEAEATMFMLEAERRSDERVYRAQQEQRAQESHNLAIQQGAHDLRRMELAEAEQTLRNMVFIDQLNRRKAPGTGPGIPSRAAFGVGVDPDKLFPPGQIDNPQLGLGLKRPWETVQTSPIQQREFLSNDFLSDSELYQAYKAWRAHQDMNEYRAHRTRRDMVPRGLPGNMIFEQPSYGRYGVERRGR